jgi:hypothetical protein
MNKKMLSITAVCLLCASTAFAQVGDESGVTKKYRLSLGSYTVGSTDAYVNNAISYTGLDTPEVTLKLDFVTSRLKRHETMISYQHFNNAFQLGSAGSMLFGEYRWRFDRFGRAYYGVNAGIWKLNISGSDTLSTTGSALGYHFNAKNFIEFRYSLLETSGNFSNVMIGTRF